MRRSHYFLAVLPLLAYPLSAQPVGLTGEVWEGTVNTRYATYSGSNGCNFSPPTVNQTIQLPSVANPELPPLPSNLGQCSWGSITALSQFTLPPREPVYVRHDPALNAYVPVNQRVSVRVAQTLRGRIPAATPFEEEFVTTVRISQGTTLCTQSLTRSLRAPGDIELPVDTGACAVERFTPTEQLTFPPPGPDIRLQTSGELFFSDIQQVYTSSLVSYEEGLVRADRRRTGIGYSVVTLYQFRMMPRLNVTAAPAQLTNGPDSAASPIRVTVENTGGQTLRWQARITSETGGNWLRFENPNPSGELTRQQTAAIPLVADSAGLAPGTYTARILVTAPGATDDNREIVVRLTQSSRGDILTLKNATPDAANSLTAGAVSFTADTDYTLDSRDSANLRLRLENAAGGIIAQSAPQTVQKGSGTASLRIDSASIPDDGAQVFLRSVLTAADSGSLLLMSAPVTYRASSPDRLTLIRESLSPAPGIRVEAGSRRAFTIPVRYTLGSKSNGTIAVRIVDQAGQTLGTEQTFPVTANGPDGGPLAPARLDVEVPAGASQVTARVELRDSGGAVLAEASQSWDTGTLELTLTGLEVAQSVQNADSQLPLILGKATVVRAFVRQTGLTEPAISGVIGQLRATRRSADGRVTELGPVEARLVGSASAQPSRAQLDHSINFEVPFRWIRPAVTGEQETLTFRVTIRMQEGGANVTLRDASREIARPFQRTFDQNRPLRVAVVRLCHPTSAQPGSTVECPGPDIANPARFLFTGQMYPMHELGFDVEQISGDMILDEPLFGEETINGQRVTFDDYAATDKVFRRMDAILDELNRSLPRARWFHQIVGVIPQVRTLSWRGLPKATWAGGRGRAILLQDFGGANPDVLAHDFGHNMGLRHPNRGEIGLELRDFLDRNKCTVARDDSTNWIYPADTYTHEIGYSFLPSLSLFAADRFDIMSFCPRDATWISDFHYNQVFQQFQRIRTDASTPIATLPAFPVPGRAKQADHRELEGGVYEITGFLAADASAGGIDNALPVFLEPDTPVLTGAACLVFLDGSAELGRHCFTPGFLGVDGPVRAAGFLIRAQVPANTSAMRLTFRNRDLDRVESAGAPRVTVSQPLPGSTVSGVGRLAWNTAYFGPRPLRFRVFYSNDSGLSWFPLTLETRRQELEFDSRALFTGPTVQFRITAIAGLDAAEARVGPFATTERPVTEIVPRPVLFGDVRRGQVAERIVTIRNTGAGVLALRWNPIASEEFQLAAPGTQMTVAPGASRTVPFRFLTDTVGRFNTNWVLTTNDPANSALTVALEAVSVDTVAPRIVVDSARLDFGTVAVGQTRALRVLITNAGGSPLNVTVAAADNPLFTVSGARAPFAVSANGRQELSITFAPTRSGAQTGVLTISSNDGIQPNITIPLAGTGDAGTGVPIAPKIEVSPTALEFGPLTVGQTRDLPLTLRNLGNGPLRISAVAFTDTQYQISVNPPIDISPASSTTLSVRYAPTASGQHAAQLTITSSDAENPTVTVRLAGSAVSRDAVNIPAIKGPVSLVQQLDYTNCPEIAATVSIVNDQNGPVPSIPLNSISCAWDGAPIRCAFTAEEGPMSIVIIAGYNGLSPTDQQGVTTAAKVIVEFMKGDDRVSLVHLETTANPIQQFTSSRETLNRALDSLREAGNGSALYDSLSTAVQLLSTEQGRRKAIFLLTPLDNLSGNLRDGEFTFGRVIGAGIPVYTYTYGPGLTNATLQNYLKRISNETNGLYAQDERFGIIVQSVRSAFGTLNGQQRVILQPPADGRNHDLTINYNALGLNARGTRAINGCRP